MPRLHKRIKLCKRCHKEQRTTVAVIGDKKTKLCDRCAEELGIEEQKQYEQMRGWIC